MYKFTQTSWGKVARSEWAVHEPFRGFRNNYQAGIKSADSPLNYLAIGLGRVLWEHSNISALIKLRQRPNPKWFKGLKAKWGQTRSGLIHERGAVVWHDRWMARDEVILNSANETLTFPQRCASFQGSLSFSRASCISLPDLNCIAPVVRCAKCVLRACQFILLILSAWS